MNFQSSGQRVTRNSHRLPENHFYFVAERFCGRTKLFLCYTFPIMRTNHNCDPSQQNTLANETDDLRVFATANITCVESKAFK